jgi:demethylmenaquinone methyltransferase/2-methoxy-6-polyprenyl-1,4-benzoquinol methylase
MNDTDFGYQSVSFDEKKERVSKIFSKVAPYYDRMNDVLSIGLHRYWKKNFLDAIAVHEFDVVLDLACGSGDIIFGLVTRHKAKKFYAIDPNLEMLSVAKLRAAQLQLYDYLPISDIHFIQANGEDLSMIESHSISVLTLSFGFRNVADRTRCLQEIYRVLKPGGVLYLLEFSKVTKPFDHFYDLYRQYFLPVVGNILFNDQASYQYLADSIAVFWDQNECLNALSATGFVKTVAENFTQGIVCFYKGEKPLCTL